MVRMLKVIIAILFCLNISFVSVESESNDMMVTFEKEKYFGDDDVKPSLNSVYSKEIRLVEQYLNGFYSFSAQFKQSNKNNDISYGKIFISKPEKIRCEYSNPSKLLLIMNESKITYYDKDLDEISYTNADINALKLLSLNEVKFANLNLVQVIKDSGFISFSIKEYSKELKQNLIVTLRFNYPVLKLSQVTVTAEDSEVNMIFDKIIYNKDLGKQLFYFNRNSIRKYK